MKNSIDSYLTKFDKSYINLKEQNKNFIGWITLVLHPKYEKYTLKSEDIKKEIKAIIGKKEYKIIFGFMPVWNSSEPKIIEV